MGTVGLGGRGKIQPADLERILGIVTLGLIHECGIAEAELAYCRVVLPAVTLACRREVQGTKLKRALVVGLALLVSDSKIAGAKLQDVGCVGLRLVLIGDRKVADTVLKGQRLVVASVWLTNAPLKAPI